jgi:hypothetical protein
VGIWAPPGMGTLAKLAASFHGADSLMPPIPSHSFLPPRGRDQNGFYWKPIRPSGAVSEFSFECQQWRHGVQAERFSGQIVFDLNQAEISGALECEIHAENLTNVATLLIPVRITTRRANVADAATNHVDTLIAFN